MEYNIIQSRRAVCEVDIFHLAPTLRGIIVLTVNPTSKYTTFKNNNLFLSE